MSFISATYHKLHSNKFGFDCDTANVEKSTPRDSQEKESVIASCLMTVSQAAWCLCCSLLVFGPKSHTCSFFSFLSEIYLDLQWYQN